MFLLRVCMGVGMGMSLRELSSEHTPIHEAWFWMIIGTVWKMKACVGVLWCPSTYHGVVGEVGVRIVEHGRDITLYGG